jgi:Flp pilus assembly protein CpaB
VRASSPARTSAERPAGRTGRRRALPPGRAVAGGLAVALAVVVVFAGWVDARGASARTWVVASSALPAGTRLTAADLTTATLRLGDGPAASSAFGRPSALIGRSLAVAVTPGELILRSEVPAATTGASLRPVAVSIAPGDLVDLAAGDLVDVLETAGTAPDTRTTVVVRGARVLSTAQPSSGLLGSGGDDIVTLGEATLAEVTATVSAEHAGTLDVVVGEPSDGDGSGPGTVTGS